MRRLSDRAHTELEKGVRSKNREDSGHATMTYYGAYVRLRTIIVSRVIGEVGEYYIKRVYEYCQADHVPTRRRNRVEQSRNVRFGVRINEPDKRRPTFSSLRTCCASAIDLSLFSCLLRGRPRSYGAFRIHSTRGTSNS